jgi:SAM-dependent methyltransferase
MFEAKNRERTWKKLWKCLNRKDILLWNYSSELEYSMLIRAVPKFAGKRCLETGSGTGRVSLRLRQDGARVLLVDVSREAIEFSRRLFSKANESANFMVASMLALPLRVSSIDFVWNSGVFEHFKSSEQQLAISEALHVLKKEGKMIVLVPNRESRFVEFFTTLSMRMQTWPYGYAKPLSPKDFAKLPFKPASIASFGFLWQLRYFYIPVVQTVANAFFSIARHIFPYLEKVDKNYPGYFLVATFVK